MGRGVAHPLCFGVRARRLGWKECRGAKGSKAVVAESSASLKRSILP